MQAIADFIIGRSRLLRSSNCPNTNSGKIDSASDAPKIYKRESIVSIDRTEPPRKTIKTNISREVFLIATAWSNPPGVAIVGRCKS